MIVKQKDELNAHCKYCIHHMENMSLAKAAIASRFEALHHS